MREGETEAGKEGGWRVKREGGEANVECQTEQDPYTIHLRTFSLD